MVYGKTDMHKKGDTLNPIISLVNQRKQYVFTTFRLFTHEILLSLWRHFK